MITPWCFDPYTASHSYSERELQTDASLTLRKKGVKTLKASNQYMANITSMLSTIFLRVDSEASRKVTHYSSPLCYKLN